MPLPPRPDRGLGAILQPPPAGWPSLRAAGTADYPASVDLRGQDSPVRNQGGENSCCPFACCGMFDFLLRKWVQPDLPIYSETSEQAVYYWVRSWMNTVGTDSGAADWVVLGIMANYGLIPKTGWGCPDAALWPYSQPMTLAPGADVEANGKLHLIGQPVNLYWSGTDLSLIRSVLSSGLPFVFGFPVYASWYYSADPFMAYPPSGGLVGGHEVMAVGYDDNLSHGGQTGYVICRNSWGPGYGDQGYFYVPYPFMQNYAGSGYTAHGVTYDGYQFPFVGQTRKFTSKDSPPKAATLQQQFDGSWAVVGVS